MAKTAIEMKSENIKLQDIGIEIETVGQRREVVATAVATYFGTEDTVEYKGGDYDTYEVKDNKGRTWKFMKDSSLSGGFFRNCEVVSPILYWEDLTEFNNIVKVIKESGAYVDSSCGIHIHIGARGMDGKMLKNLVNVFQTHEDLIYNSLDVSYYDNRYEYCQKTNVRFITKINSVKNLTKNDLLDIWYNTLAPFESRTRHYNESRYHGLNLHAVETKGTVEFRMFNGTLEGEKIIGYIQFCMAIMSEAKTMKSAKKNRIITDNKKFAMRNWLRKLGLNGNDFKFCRKTMLANLEGNSAMR